MKYFSPRGLTLMELLIALSITAIVGVVFLEIVVQNNGLVLIQQAKVSQGLSLNNASSAINNAIHNAAQIADNCPVSTCTINFTSTKNSIVLAIPSLDESGNPITNTYDYEVITADPNDSTILRDYIYPSNASTRKNQDEVLSTSLSSITFYYLDTTGNNIAPPLASQVNFVINLKQRAGATIQSSSSSGQVNLRNN